jgi:hypothetical protein
MKVEEGGEVVNITQALVGIENAVKVKVPFHHLYFILLRFSLKAKFYLYVYIYIH